jgi:Zn-finger nucleic acid-binding protein
MTEHTRSPAGLLCPVCRVNLVLTERQNVEIDYCPQCRGVWLDRGEIGKIVERSFEQRPPREAWDERPGGGREGYEAHRDPHEQRRRSDDRGEGPMSWLSDLFGRD